MKFSLWIEQIPLWGTFVSSLIMVVASITVGTFLGQVRRRKPDHESEGSLGTIISATLGLLAFMLAFTFGIASERFQVRRQLLLDEVNVISTTYLRAGLLMEPHRTRICRLLKEYVDLRVDLTKMAPQGLRQHVNETIARSQLIQDQMWASATEIAMAERSSEIDALFIDSLNEMMNTQTSRFTVFRYRIPPMIWYTLCFITVLSMATVGYQVGLSGNRVLKIGIVLALTFASVILLISDLDDPTQGSLQVSQQPLIELQQRMQAQLNLTTESEQNRTNLNTSAEDTR